MNYSLTLAPGETKSVNVVGDYFAIVYSPVDLQVRINGNEEEVYSQGDSYELPKGDEYKRLECRNASATATANVVIYAGKGRYVQRRQSVLENPTAYVAAVLPSQQIPGNGTVTLDGIASGSQIRRKSIVVTNSDPANSLFVRDGSGHPGTEVFFKTSVTLPISGAVQIINTTANPIVCYLAEIWYVVP